MDVVYTGGEITKDEKVCFLAGPTLNDKKALSWRVKAIEMFDYFNFSGTLYIPEVENRLYYNKKIGTREMQLDHKILNNADIVMFWIPRSDDMLALYTNVEFGYLLNKGNLVYGRPNDAVMCEFLDFLYKEKLGKDYCETLEDTVKETIKTLRRVR